MGGVGIGHGFGFGCGVDVGTGVAGAGVGVDGCSDGGASGVGVEVSAGAGGSVAGIGTLPLPPVTGRPPIVAPGRGSPWTWTSVSFCGVGVTDAFGFEDIVGLGFAVFAECATSFVCAAAGVAVPGGRAAPPLELV